MITALAKEHMGFDGLVTADWGTMGTARGWGLESVPLPARVAMWFAAGSHQFGSDPEEPIWEAYDTGLIDDATLDTAAAKVLENFFALGLFENPYVDAAAADTIVRSVESRRGGFEAQKLAMVILTNRDHALSRNQAPKYLPISGARYTDANASEAPEPGEYVCDTDDDGVVSVHYDGGTDGLVGSDTLDDFLDAYDYTSEPAGTTLGVEAAVTLEDADIAVIRVNSRSNLDFADTPEAAKLIDAFRARDVYMSLEVTCEDAGGVPIADWIATNPTAPNLKIVLVETMNNPAIVRAFINGLVSLDDVLDPAVQCPETGEFPLDLGPWAVRPPTLDDENILPQGGRGVNAFVV